MLARMRFPMKKANATQYLLKRSRFLWSLLFVLLLAACSSPDDAASAEDDVATQQAVALSHVEATAAPALSTIESTDTPISPTKTPMPTATQTLIPTATDTPEPTATNTPEPTATRTASPTPLPPTATPPAPTSAPIVVVDPTVAPEPVLGLNLIPNGSFEEGHYHQNGIPELQLPDKWRIAWDEGPTGMGSAAWDVYVRPEVTVLSTSRLPPAEHGLYIYNGQHTLKIFKGQGAVSFRLMSDVTLEPGTYIIEAKMFADIVEKWEGGQKIWAQDPYAAEFRFLVGDGGTFWTPQRFGQINVHNFTFTVDEFQTITVAIAMRGRYAISNNGWFIDDLSLRRIE